MNFKQHSPYSASRLDQFAEKLLEVSNTTATDYLLIDPYSIGDAVHTLSLVDEFRKKYCTKGESVNFICSLRSLPVAKLFKNINYCVGIDCSPHEYQLEALAERYGPVPIGRPILMPPDMYSRGWLGRLSEAGRLNSIEAKKLILELDLDVIPQVPQLDSNLYEEISIKANSIGLCRNSVIIFNHANTIKEANSEIYKPLSKYWGDRVYYDATIQGKGVVSWAKPLTMTIEEIPYYAQFVGTVVNIRSGITDLLAFSDANVITIYPNSDMLFDWTGNKKRVMQAFKNLTLAKLRLSDKAREFPLFCDEDDSIECVADKLNSILEKSIFV